VAAVELDGGVAEAHDTWTAFYRDEYPRLAEAMFVYTNDRDLACELAQEAMSRAWSHWTRGSRIENPAAWTCRVAINLANSKWRRGLLARRIAAHRADDETIPELDIGTRLAVRQAVAELPPRQKTAVVLRYLFDFSIADVARLMRCREGTVTALTTQGIEKLRSGGALTEHEGKA
jgi:RNA polymerase sigma-70 factor (ECF subfamily)